MNHDDFSQIFTTRFDHQQASLLSFAALVAAFVTWVAVVVVLFPRWLGRLLSFLINRTAAGKYHIHVPFLHLYPLGGRIVAHSAIFTTPDMCVSVEQLALQFRWWHFQQLERIPQPLGIDSPEVFEAVARVQQQTDLENSASLFYRLFYRLRRFWRQTVSYPDYSIPDEPKSLISFVLFGLRVRIVNNEANFNYVQDVLALAQKSTSEQNATDAPHIELEISDLPKTSFSAPPDRNISTTPLAPLSSVPDNTSSTQPVEKTFSQRVLEHTSLRINKGSFYICDMGQSPLVQITADSAKIRYRCGAPSCSLDKSRSRVRVGVSSLMVSSASAHDIRAILENGALSPSMGNLPHDVSGTNENCGDPSDLLERTNLLIRRVESEGHRGIEDPFLNESRTHSATHDQATTRRHRRSAFVQNLPIFGNGNSNDVKASRKAQTLQCIDILHATTAVFEYVVDEPGSNINSLDLDASASDYMYHNITNFSTGNIEPPPPPLRQLSILLHGAELTYDFRGMAHLWCAIGCFQTTLYDYSPYSDILRRRDGRRATARLQIDVEATPKPLNSDGSSQSKHHPLAIIPFSPRSSTWLSLLSTGIADTRGAKISAASSDVHNLDDVDNPASRLNIQCSRLLFRLEGSSDDSPHQKVVLDLKDPSVLVEGVVNIPLLKSQSAVLTRIAQVPEVWFEEHIVSTELVLSKSEIVYVSDLHRVISDILATSDQCSVKPAAVNYSVPYRETIRICAADSYSIVLSCGRDNAWEDILREEGDEYGKLKLGGGHAELVLSPNIPTVFYGDSFSRSWSLSLPNAVATLETSADPFQEMDDSLPSTDYSAAHDSPSNGRPGTRLSTSGRRPRNSTGTTPSVPDQSGSPEKGTCDGTVQIDILHVGAICKIEGKSLFHEDRRYLSTAFSAFPDAINKSEISITLDEAVMDLNPHHITHVLNIVRNYSGAGSHVVSTAERLWLENKRRQVATKILRDGRYPSQEECLVLGLSPGYTLSPEILRSGSDDLTVVSVGIGFVVVRLHDLPHAATQFDLCSQNVYSVSADKLRVKFHSTRLGSDFTVSSGSDESNLFVRMGSLPMRRDNTVPVSDVRVSTLPTATLGDFQIRKVSVASEEWGSFFSSIRISVNHIQGCLPDYALNSFKRMGVSFVPHPISAHVSSVAVLLSVDNIEVSVGSVDLMLLSLLNTPMEKDCSQINSFFPTRTATVTSHRVRNASACIPRVLAGITHIRMCEGFRVVSSSLECENQGLVSRIFFPMLSVDVVVSSERTCLTWIDEISLRAQISQVGSNESRQNGLLWNDGLPIRAANISETLIDLVYASKSSTWSPNVALKQSSHVYTRHKEREIVKLPWCTGRPLFHIDDTSDATSQGKHRRASWWNFITKFRMASIFSKYQDHLEKEIRRDVFSARVPGQVVVDVSPEFFTFVYNLISRLKNTAVVNKLSPSQGRGRNELVQKRASLISQELISMWHKFEKLQPAKWTTIQKHLSASSFKKGLEMKAVKFRFFCPVILPREQWTPFLSGSREEKWIYLSLSSGINLLVDNYLLPEPSDVRNRRFTDGLLPNFIRTNVVHFSTSTATVGCNDTDLAVTTEVLVLNHERNTVTHSDAVEMLAEEPGRRDRGTLIVKIGSIKVGYPWSSLELYSNVGLLTSILYLLFTAVVNEANVLAKEYTDTELSLSKLLSCQPLSELIHKDPAQVRVVFVKYLNQILSIQNAEERTGSLTESDFRSLRNSSIRKRDILPIQSDVKSLHISLQNFTFTVAKEDIVCFDSLLCKGGKTSSSNFADLGGYVLNAAFGTFLISIHDDVAADALGTVSKVATLLGFAVGNIPSFRHLYRHSSQNEISMHGTSHNDVNAILRHSQSSNTIKESTSLRISSRRLLSSKDEAAYQGQFPASSSYRDMKHKSKSSTALTARRHKKKGSLSESVPIPHLNSMSEHQHQEVSNRMSEHFDEDMTIYPPRFAAATSSLIPSSRVTLDSTLNDPFSSGCARPECTVSMNSDKLITDDGYLHVPVRTAGDTGPPRKRSKCMVPVTPLSTLPFASSDLHAEPRNNLIPFQSASRIWNLTTPKISPRRTNITENQTSNPTRMAQSSPSLIKAGGTIRISESFEVTLFASCREIVSRYYRRCEKPRSFARSASNKHCRGNIEFIIHAPKLTFMLQPLRGMSIVFTAMSSELFSSTNPMCKLSGSIAQIGVLVSVTQSHRPSNLPKLIVSSRISNFSATLQATDLQSVLHFREDFKKDLLGLATAFVSTKRSVSEMVKASKLSPTTTAISTQNLSSFSTLAFDILFEESEVELAGFHPRDGNMTVSYVLGGMFFSLAAFGNDNAALTLALRIYDHGLRLSSPSWPNNEFFSFPSLDACGVQWSEKVKLPTFLKVTTKPLVSLTSFQGLRHVLFTVAGLLAFQNTPVTTDKFESCLSLPSVTQSQDLLGYDVDAGPIEKLPDTETSPFAKSILAWERTKGIRMDISICPLALSLASGQVVAQFRIDAVSGILEWNKLVLSGVQLRTAVSIPKVSLSFLRMPTTDFSAPEIKPDVRRVSLSIALEKARVDVLKSQKDLTHTFIFRTSIGGVSGQVRPWRLLLDAAVWADEQEFVSDLQSINYSALSASRQRPIPKATSLGEGISATEHRLVLFGASVERVMLAIPLLNSEQPSSSRLAVRATDLHLFARHRFHNMPSLARNIFQVKSRFIGVLWENSSLLSSHHIQITVGVETAQQETSAHIGKLNVVLNPGTWRICPRRDVLIAIIEAKNRKDNKVNEYYPANASEASGIPAVGNSSLAENSVSNATEKEDRLLVENLQLRINRGSGFIEGLDEPGSSPSMSQSSPENVSGTTKVSVPAFSISAVRIPKEDFDLVDIDFSGREGEFPRKCLGRVSSLFSDMIGVVASEHERSQKGEVRTNSAHAAQPREVSRNLSVMVRFGGSLYRAQEEVYSGIESRICFSARRSSTLLVSITKMPVIYDDCSHTTVVTGVSPKLTLELTPVLEGADVQSLRLIDGRFLHGICPCHSPHSAVHINRVIALTGAKTLLLLNNRVRQERAVHPDEATSQESASRLQKVPFKRAVLYLGKPRLKRVSAEVLGDRTRRDPDIHLQLRLSSRSKADSEISFVDLAVERAHFEALQAESNQNNEAIQLTAHSSIHDVILRGKWDILNFKLRLREHLFFLEKGIAPKTKAKRTFVSNIINRLDIESLQYQKHTLKLNVDALAAMWMTPPRRVMFESTIVYAEVSYTLRKAITKVSTLWKKLENEVKLAMEREVKRKSIVAANSLVTADDEIENVSPLEWNGQLQTSVSKEKKNETSGSESASSGSTGTVLRRPLLDPRELTADEETFVSIKGDEVTVLMRGYQFDETRHSAVISLVQYSIHYKLGFQEGQEGESHLLKADFQEMSMSYNDDVRRIRSELFKIPEPKLKLTLTDTEAGFDVKLRGDLEVRLGHGFYNWQEFRELLILTVRGIAPAPPRSNAVVELIEPVLKEKEQLETWEERRVNTVDVELHPRIDVIGDLTADVLPMLARLKTQVDAIPRYMYGYMIVPLESLSKTLCQPLEG